MVFRIDGSGPSTTRTVEPQHEMVWEVMVSHECTRTPSPVSVLPS